jgi:hypothetical protein
MPAPVAKRKGFFDLYGEAALKDGVLDAQGGTNRLPLQACKGYLGFEALVQA